MSFSVSRLFTSKAYECLLNIGINVIKAITIMPKTKKLLRMPLKTLENKSVR